MNLANKITISRVIMIPVFLVVYTGSFLAEPARSLAACGIFVVASATDWLDGYIARSRNLITNFGKFADPLADKLLVAAALVCMVEKGLLPGWVVVLILSREFIIMGFRTVAASENIVIAASWWGKLKTVSQMAMIIVLLSGYGQYLGETIIGLLVVLVVVLTVVSAVDYIYKNAGVIKG